MIGAVDVWPSHLAYYYNIHFQILSFPNVDRLKKNHDDKCIQMYPELQYYTAADNIEKKKGTALAYKSSLGALIVSRTDSCQSPCKYETTYRVTEPKRAKDKKCKTHAN